jgi:hypothetical protein
LLVVLAVASLFIPAVFQVALRALIKFEAWQHHSRVEIAEVEGSFYEPVRLQHTRWTFTSRAGSVARVAIDEAEADFDWRALLPWQGGRWFQRLNVTGVAGRVEIPVVIKRDPSTPAGPPRLETAIPQWWPTPGDITANDVDLTIVTGDNSIRIEESQWILSESKAGFVKASQIVVKQPWLNRTFRGVHGATALQASKVTIANLELDKDVVVTRTSADLTKIATGVLSLDIEIDAFEGDFRIQANTLPGQREVKLHSTSTFRNINVASLATFLGLSEAAGGRIDSGSFTFDGALADLPHSFCSLRLNARNFQWESRQLDSLVIGAELLNQHVQIYEFELKQGHNDLSLSGELGLPRGQTPWWQNEFALNIAARVENLTDLSALLLPDFQYAAGHATVDGSIRGKDQQFHGQLIVSGSDLTWRKAPIQELHAALRLNGNELQLATLDLINRDDYVHGRGVINILGPKQYWGELRASVEDLATYSSLLQKPLVPEPLAGGAVVNWSGEGSAARYSGSFFARLQKVRSLGKTGAQLHPVNAELQGVYAPGTMQFSRFAVSDNNSSFSANVQVGKQSVSLSEILLKQGMETRLEGEAVLPLDLWNAWPGGDPARILVETDPVQFKLSAKNLRLGEALRLSGWNWPLDGGVTGEIWGSGAGPKLDLGGQLKLVEGKLPLGWYGDALSNVSADITLAGPKVVLGNSLLNHVSGRYGTHGEIDLQNLREPVLNLDLQSQQAEAALLPELARASFLKYAGPVSSSLAAYATILDQNGVVVSQPAPGPPWLKAVSRLDLHIAGPAGKSTISGEVGVQEIVVGPALDLRNWWTTEHVSLPAIFGWAGEPWSNCKLDLHCTFPPRGNNPPRAPFWSGDLKITGTGATPELVGTVAVAASKPAEDAPAAVPPGEADVKAKPISISSNGFPLDLVSASMTFRPGSPLDPSVDLSLAGALHALPFHASIIGPLSHRIAFIDSEEAREILLGKTPLGGIEALGGSLLQPRKIFEKPAAPAVDPAPAPVPPAPATPQPPVAVVPAPAPAPVPTPEAKP